jgi:hypothetical protein
MAEDGISFRIELDSADAEAAIERLREASETLFGTMEKLGEALEHGGFGALEKTALAAAAAVAGLTTGLFELAKSGSESAIAVSNLAAQMGASVEQASGLRAALIQLEANPETLQRAFERMGNTIEKVFPEVVKSIKTATTDAQKASLDLLEAEVKLSAFRSNTPVSPVLTREIELKRQLLAVDTARIAKADQAANSVQVLTQYVDALAKGTSTAGINANVTVDNVIKGLVASLGPAVTQLEGVGNNLGGLSKQAPTVQAALLKLADVFHNMTDKTLKMSVATQLFGRRDAKDMVVALSEGSHEVQELDERYQHLHLTITEADDVIARKFVLGMNRLGYAIGIVSTQFGLLFAPAFTEALTAVATLVEDSRENILNWGKAIRDTVVPILQTFVRVLSGVPEAGKDDWLVRLIEGFKIFGRQVVTVVNALIIPALTGLLATANFVAAGINGIFGTAFTGLELIIGVFVARMTLALATMIVGLGPVGLAIITLSLAIGLLITYWPQVKAAAQQAADAVMAAWEAVKQFFDEWVTTPVANAWGWIKETWDGIVSWISDKITQATQLITDWVTTPVANAWQWLKDKWDEILASLGFSGGGVVGGDSGLGIGHAASGGLLGGRGTGTSDSNLAWVSRGEYITPARAVAQPGVLAFLEALRVTGGNLAGVLDGMGRFALGGMVRAPLSIPAFAGGGMNHVTINFPGLPEITGLRASSDVVDQLRKAAAMAQVRSGGRKPSRYS